MEPNFPSNSNKSKSQGVPAKKSVKKVTTSDVTTRKKPMGRRIRELIFVGPDGTSIFEYLILDIVVPSTKDLFLDVVTMGLERKFYGESRPGRRSSGYNHIYRSAADFAYNRVSTSSVRSTESPRLSARARKTHDFDELLYNTRQDANEVLSQLYMILEQYEVVTVTDLYNLAGVTPEFTDDAWGWTNLAGSDVQRTRDGYILDLPRPSALER